MIIKPSTSQSMNGMLNPYKTTCKERQKKKRTYLLRFSKEWIGSDLIQN